MSRFGTPPHVLRSGAAPSQVTTRIAGQLPEDRIGKEALPEVSDRPKQPTSPAVVIGWDWVGTGLPVADTDNGEAAITVIWYRGEPSPG